MKSNKYCSCLYYSANALSRILTKTAEDEFRITGLSPSHGFLLMSVNENPGIRPTEICELMQLTPSTITRLIEKMEAKKLLIRKQKGRDTEVFPTEEGIKLHPKLKEAWNNLYKNYSKKLGIMKSKRLTNDIYMSYKKLINQ